MIDFDHSCLNFKNLHSLISSLDLNSTPLGDVDRNGNGSAGAIGQHRQTTQQQRVQNKHHDNINTEIGWQLFDPTLKHGKSSIFMNKIYIGNSASENIVAFALSFSFPGYLDIVPNSQTMNEGDNLSVGLSV